MTHRSDEVTLEDYDNEVGRMLTNGDRTEEKKSMVTEDDLNNKGLPIDRGWAWVVLTGNKQNTVGSIALKRSLVRHFILV